MARRLRIGVDVDDVIVDFVSAFRQEAEAVLGRKFPRPPGSWSFKNWGVTKEEIERVWERIKISDNWFYMNCSALPGVPENLPWLVENHDVYFITARIETPGFSVQKQTQLSLSDIGIQFPTVLVEHNKGAIADALRLDAFIDDKIENLRDVDSFVTSTAKLFVMNRSHNEDYPTPESWTRVDNFKEFVDKIQEME